MVVEQQRHRRGPLQWIAALDQEARLAVAHRIVHAFNVRDNHRHTGRHRFEHNHRQAFAEEARQHEEIDLGELGVDVDLHDTGVHRPS